MCTVHSRSADSHSIESYWRVVCTTLIITASRIGSTVVETTRSEFLLTLLAFCKTNDESSKTNNHASMLVVNLHGISGIPIRGCRIGMQGPQLCAKPRHFCKLDVATSRMAFLDLNLHVLQVATPNSNFEVFI